MSVSLLVTVALGAPQFVAAEPVDAEVARGAWDAAVACTGWEPEAADEVRIERGNVPKGFLGLASTDERGRLYRIELDATDGRSSEVIVHEVAHAWVSEGPTALVEGRAELLADCMVHERPGLAPLQWDDGRELVSMPDLRSWRAADDHGPSVNPLMRTDAYLGAARLVRLASLVLPDGALWPEADNIDWIDLDAMLADAGQPGELLRDVLRATPEVQRKALSDRDQDGLPLVGEQMLGTDPDRFDSDADGWWDGAEVPVDAVPLPFDGTPMCSGWATPASGGVAVLKTGGNLRGSPAPMPALRANDEVFLKGRVAVVGRASILVELEGDPEVVSGGLWARVHGKGLVEDDACVSDASRVVWASDPALREAVQPLAEALQKAVARAERRFGADGRRLAVQLGGTSTTVDGPVIHLSTHEVRTALRTGALDDLAYQAVAMRRVWDESAVVREWRDVVALANLLARDSRPPAVR
ncbi:MAG: hypothetical protein H6737_29665 [Alphaproteobacteria bacterium]|nr:hypothetical protein [Alphaproteobacteria bacterium]